MDWIESIDPKLFAQIERPNFPLPTFPWKAFEASLKHLFAQTELHLHHDIRGWKSREEVVNDNQNVLALTLYASPIPKPSIFYIGEMDLKLLATSLFEEEEAVGYFLEKPLIEGFYQFILVTLLNEIDRLSFAENLSFRLGQSGTLHSLAEEEQYFEIVVRLQLGKREVQGRLLTPLSFYTLWKKHFMQLPLQQFNEALRKKIVCDIALELGYTELAAHDFKNLQLGDLVVLDRATYDPQFKEGFVVLTFNNEALFRGKIQKNGIKILEYPRLEEVTLDMEEEFKMDASFEEVQEGEEKEAGSVNASANASTLLQNLPIQLIIEAGRLKMTYDELEKLTPGKIIEMHLPLEQGVDLVVQGKKIGKGELVKLDEMLAVRITHI